MIYYHHYQTGTKKGKCGTRPSGTDPSHTDILIEYNYIALCNYLKGADSKCYKLCAICYPEVFEVKPLHKYKMPAITTSTAYITKTNPPEESVKSGLLETLKSSYLRDRLRDVESKPSAVAQAVSKLESDRKKTYYWDPYFCDGDWW